MNGVLDYSVDTSSNYLALFDSVHDLGRAVAAALICHPD